ncbi:MAG: hypothetical protein ACM3MG_01505 [Bacillota bacterium]
MKILLTALVALHILWIGLATWADAASTLRASLPTNLLTSSVLLFIWAGYQALSWVHGALKAET